MKAKRTCSWLLKFETFPVWNVPLKHPLNIAYEAATVDLKDVNMIDSFHFDAYNKVAVNYNRDVETFPVIKRIIEKLLVKNLFINLLLTWCESCRIWDRG